MRVGVRVLRRNRTFGLLTAAAFVSAWACGEPAGEGGGSGGVVLGAALTWSVPDRPYGDILYNKPNGELVADMNGDGLVDLLLVGRGEVVNGAPDSPHFLVHLGTGAGFGEAQTWPVPAGVQSFDGWPREESPCAHTQHWTLADMDGDGRLDLLLQGARAATPQACEATYFGDASTPYWVVHRNTGSGFEIQGRPLPLPPGVIPYLPQYGDRASLLDLDGDGRADLVAMSAPNAKVPGFGESPHWLFFKNAGDAFLRAAPWSVPAGGDRDRGFSNDIGTVRNSRCEATAATCGESWVLADLDGDRRPELVVTAYGTGSGEVLLPGAPSSPHWRVFANTGAGFGEERAFALPASVEPLLLTDMRRGGKSTLLDLEGDGRPELAITSDPAAPGLWQVFTIGEDGFGDEPERWSLPDVSELGEGANFDSTEGWAGFLPPSGNMGVIHWFTQDMNGDGRADLVEWESADGHRVPGGENVMDGTPADGPHWRVHLATKR